MNLILTLCFSLLGAAAQAAEPETYSKAGYFADYKNGYFVEFGASYGAFNIRIEAPNKHERSRIVSDRFRLWIYTFAAPDAPLTDDAYAAAAIKGIFPQRDDAGIKGYVAYLKPQFIKNETPRQARRPAVTVGLIPGEEETSGFIYYKTSPGIAILAQAGSKDQEAWDAVIANIRNLRLFETEAYSIKDRVYADKEYGFWLTCPDKCLYSPGSGDVKTDPLTTQFYIHPDVDPEMSFKGRVYVVDNEAELSDAELMDDAIKRADSLPPVRDAEGKVRRITDLVKPIITKTSYPQAVAGLRYMYHAAKPAQVAASFDLFRKGKWAYLVQVYFRPDVDPADKRLAEVVESVVKGFSFTPPAKPAAEKKEGK